MALIQIKLVSKSDSASDEYLNIFHFEDVVNDELDAANLLTALQEFETVYVAQLQTIMTAEYEYVRADAKQLDGTAENSITFARPGTLSGENTLPPFVTVGFKLIRRNTSTRNGYKRFTGVPESVVSPTGVINSATYITALQGVEDVLDDSLITLVEDLDPVIVRPLTQVPFTYLSNGIIGATHAANVGSQVTRKLGRGQ